MLSSLAAKIFCNKRSVSTRPNDECVQLFRETAFNIDKLHWDRGSLLQHIDKRPEKKRFKSPLKNFGKNDSIYLLHLAGIPQCFDTLDTEMTRYYFSV